MHTLFPSYEEVDHATRLLGKLDGITKLLPDADFFLLMYLREDAASSSQIEGTQATMIDAIEAEAKVNANIPKDVEAGVLFYLLRLTENIRQHTRRIIMTKDTFDQVVIYQPLPRQPIFRCREWSSLQFQG